MRRFVWSAGCGLALVLAAGCGGGDNATAPGPVANTGAPSAAPLAPDMVINEFLTAVKAGDKVKSEQLLTSIAREKTAKEGIPFNPDPKELAGMTFAVEGIQELQLPDNKRGAHVATKITITDSAGQSDSNNYIWVMRQETAGWRIAGMIFTVLDNQPFVQDFEDPADMLARQEWLQEEVARRAATAQQPMTGTPNTTVATQPAGSVSQPGVQPATAIQSLPPSGTMPVQQATQPGPTFNK